MIERDARGRWLPGKAGGPGRPPREKEVKYLKSLTDRVTLDDWGAIVDQAVRDARAGNRHARDWLSKYLLPATTAESEAPQISVLVPELKERLDGCYD